MNQNIFKNAIRDVKNSISSNNSNNSNNNRNNFGSKMKLDKKNVGCEFTEEIDFDQESLNLGEDNVAEEKLNDNVKVTKLRSSIIANAKNPYPASFDRKIEIRKNNENINFDLGNENSFNAYSAIKANTNREFYFPKKNKHLVIRNKDNQEILIHGDYNSNNIQANFIKNKKEEINDNNNNDNIFNADKYSCDKNNFSMSSSNNNNFKNKNSKQWKHDKFNETVLLNYSVFIRNLPMNITESKLRDIFSFCGPIISIYVIFKIIYTYN